MDEKILVQKCAIFTPIVMLYFKSLILFSSSKHFREQQNSQKQDFSLIPLYLFPFIVCRFLQYIGNGRQKGRSMGLFSLISRNVAIAETDCKTSFSAAESGSSFAAQISGVFQIDPSFDELLSLEGSVVFKQSIQQDVSSPRGIQYIKLNRFKEKRYHTDGVLLRSEIKPKASIGRSGEHFQYLFTNYQY